MPNIWLHIVFLIIGASVGFYGCRRDRIGVGLGTAAGASISFAVGFAEPWYLVATVIFAGLLTWRRTKANA